MLSGVRRSPICQQRLTLLSSQVLAILWDNNCELANRSSNGQSGPAALPGAYRTCRFNRAFRTQWGPQDRRVSKGLQDRLDPLGRQGHRVSKWTARPTGGFGAYRVTSPELCPTK